MFHWALNYYTSKLHLTVFCSFMPNPKNSELKRSAFEYERNTMLSKLLKNCSIYSENKEKKYVFKLCRDVKAIDKSRKWLVILKKPERSNELLTNEKRAGVIDHKCAKFRANGLIVVEIINIHDPKITKKVIVNRYTEQTVKKDTIYEVGKLVKPDVYDENIDNVYGGGIHYFETLLPAFYYRSLPSKYTGEWSVWHDNGQLKFKGYYMNGKRVGQWRGWYENGNEFLNIDYSIGTKE